MCGGGGGGGVRRKVPHPCQSEDFLSLQSAHPLLEKWCVCVCVCEEGGGGDCQHHTDKVTVGHTLLSLPSLCGCCCVLFLFFFFFFARLLLLSLSSPSPATSSLSPISRLARFTL